MYRAVGVVSTGSDDVFSRNAKRLAKHGRIVEWRNASAVVKLHRVLHVWRSFNHAEVEPSLGVDHQHAADWVEQRQTQTGHRRRNLINTASYTHTTLIDMAQNTMQIEISKCKYNAWETVQESLANAR